LEYFGCQRDEYSSTGSSCCRHTMSQISVTLCARLDAAEPGNLERTDHHGTGVNPEAAL
jgi:hypothetical protein